jgi:hypothetical protein
MLELIDFTVDASEDKANCDNKEFNIYNTPKIANGRTA